MKKIIYISITLLGIFLIGTNFITDSSKLDHKTVKASGTACKWISESGYGVGPYYVNKAWYTSYDVDDITSYISTPTIELLPCNINNANDEKLGDLFYTSTGELFNGYIAKKHEYIAESTGTGLDSIYLFNIIDGAIKEYNISTVWTSFTGEPTIVSSPTVYFSSFHPSFYNYLGTDINIMDSSNALPSYPTDVDGDGKWTFTCVCAEY